VVVDGPLTPLRRCAIAREDRASIRGKGEFDPAMLRSTTRRAVPPGRAHKTFPRSTAPNVRLDERAANPARPAPDLDALVALLDKDERTADAMRRARTPRRVRRLGNRAPVPVRSCSVEHRGVRAVTATWHRDHQVHRRALSDSAMLARNSLDRRHGQQPVAAGRMRRQPPRTDAEHRSVTARSCTSGADRRGADLRRGRRRVRLRGHSAHRASDRDRDATWSYVCSVAALFDGASLACALRAFAARECRAADWRR